MDQNKPEQGNFTTTAASMDTSPDDQTESGAAKFFDQAVFDLHYHLLAVRTEGLPPLPKAEDHGFSVDRFGNVTLTERPKQPA